MTHPTNLTELKEEIYSETDRIMHAATQAPSRDEVLVDTTLRACNRISPELLTALLQGDTTETWT